MTEYTKEILSIFAHLELQQINSIIKTLDQDEIKIFNAEVLPNITPIASRNLIRKQLIEAALSAPQIPHASSDHLISIRSKIAQEILNAKNIELFLAQAEEKELLFLRNALTKNAKNQSIITSIEEQLNTKHPGWENKEHTTTPLWEAIINKIKQIKPEVSKQPETPKIEKPVGLWTKFVNLLKSIWNFLFGSSSSTAKKEKEPAQPPFTLEISPEENTDYEAMKGSGREYGEYLTGKSIYGNQARSPEERAVSAGTRFGITLASQVMASSATEKHTHLRTVASSLVEADDTEETARAIRAAVSSPDKDSPFNLNATHVFATGGDDALVTALEAQDIHAITEDPSILEQTGLSFSEEDRERILKYKANEDRSRAFNYAVSDFATSLGGYDLAAATRDHQGYKLKEAPKQYEDAYKAKLDVIRKALKREDILAQCTGLKFGNSIRLTVELDGKATPIEVRRVSTAGCEYTIICDEPPFGLSSEQIKELVELKKIKKEDRKAEDQAKIDKFEQFKTDNRTNLSLACASELEKNIYERKAEALSKQLLKACDELKEGESLFFDTGLEGHAMKLAIKREGGQFKFTCYDSSGALENTTLTQSVGGYLTLNGLDKNNARRANALTFSVPKEKVISEAGLNYFNNLLRLHSFAGWAEASLEKNLKHTSNQQRSQMGTWDKWMALLAQSKVYLNYIEKFTAIAGGPAAAKFDPLVQRPQNTDNCFAKRLQSSQLYELGKPTYKKLRTAILLKQKEGLLDDICGSKDAEKREKPLVKEEYIHMLKNVRSEFLSPQELHELSRQLSEVQTTPSNEYYAQYFQGLIGAHKKLMDAGYAKNKIAIDRIESKLEHYAKTYYNYLKAGKRSDDIAAVFSPDFDGSSWAGWRAGKYPLNIVDGKMNEKGLELLSGFANAQAWKASIQLLNHQILKLSVNERHINSASERSEPASLSEARKGDLINANIVSFVTGSKRDEHIKVELTIGKERREIDVESYFKLVMENKHLLTNPKVVSLLEYLRNSSTALGKKFFAEIYPAQHSALGIELTNRIKDSSSKLIKTVDQLVARENEIKGMLDNHEKKLKQLEQEVADEIALLGPDKASTKLKNTLALIALIENRDKPILKQLLREIEEKTANLLAAHTTAGSANYLMREAINGLDAINADTASPGTARKVINDFLAAKAALDKVEVKLTEATQAIEVERFEASLSERETAIKEYREQVITECLQVNPQYKILEELSSFKMGTQRDKTPQMYDKEKPSNKVGYVEGSLLDSIHKLNTQLRKDVYKAFEERVILKTSRMVAGIDSLIDPQADYQGIVEQAQGLTAAELPPEIKAKWGNELFRLWIKHEKDETLQTLLKNKANDPEAIKQAFHQFVERHTHLKLAALKDAKYPIDLSMQQMQDLGWSESKLAQVEKNLATRDTAVLRALLRKKIHGAIQRSEAGAQPKAEAPVKAANFLTADQLSALHDGSGVVTTFDGPDVDFLSQAEREALDGSTMSFLRANKTPTCDDTSKEACTSYFTQVAKHLEKLQKHKGLENKNERIIEFCLAASAQIFSLPFPPPKELLAELREAITKGYLDPNSEPDKQYVKAFNGLENEERSKILATLIKLSLAEVAVGDDNTRKVSPKFYSMVKQWERLISPPDSELSEALSKEKLTPNGTEPEDFEVKPEDPTVAAKSSHILKAIDTALHESHVSLEKLYEGQKGLQRALAQYAKDKGLNPATDANLGAEIRGIADRLAMRNGEALLSRQFITYFSNSQILLSGDKGINSTPGREFFIRAFIDAFQHADKNEKIQLLKFLDNLTFGAEACKLKVNHEEFRDELFLQCKSIAPETFTHFESTRKADLPPIGSLLEGFINKTTSKASKAAENRLFGFAKEINTIAREIERLSKVDPDANLDQLYSRLICSKLAYQLLIDQASDEELANLGENLEYRKEMALVQTNSAKLQDGLVSFSQNLSAESAAQFKTIFNQYQAAKKFDGSKVLITKMAASDIPGFITLGNNVSLDVLHGAVYIGNSKQGIMPAYIKSHFSLQVLGMDDFPFKKLGSSYVYMEENANKEYTAKAYIIPKEDGELAIQRELRTLGSDKATMLQYLEPEHSSNLPAAIKSRINAEHYFIDEDGSIHAFAHDFTPLLKLTPTDKKGEWLGELIEHNGNKIAVQLGGTRPETDLSKKLAKLFPAEEMLSINKDTIYVPALKQYISREEGRLYITNNLSPDSARIELSISRTGVATTKKVRSKPEEEEMVKQTKEIARLQASLIQIIGDSAEQNAERKTIKEKMAELQQKIVPEYLKVKVAKLEHDLAKITRKDLESLQEKQKIQAEIDGLREQIRKIEQPENFIFVAESPLVKKQEALCLTLREAMHQAFLDYKNSSATERETAAGHYAKSKVDYLKSMTALRKMIGETNYLVSFNRGHNGKLTANDFQSILHVGNDPEKTELFIEMLSNNILTGPLTKSELEGLQKIKEHYAAKASSKGIDNSAYCLLMGVELQHYVLEREQALSGKKTGWDKVSYEKVLGRFNEQIQTLPTQAKAEAEAELKAGATAEEKQQATAQKISSFFKPFAELWRGIQAEFHDKPAIETLFAPKEIPPSEVQRRPLNINTKTTNMPIEAIEAGSLVSFTPHKDFASLVDRSQTELEKSLRKLSDPESIQAQEEGYYYENYGLFNLNTLNKLFKLTPERAGVGKLSEKNIKDLFSWLEQQGWIAKLESSDKYQLLKHPSEFFSAPKLTSYLNEQGLNAKDTQAVIDRLEVFVYETAVNGGKYALKAGGEEQLPTQVNSARKRYNSEFLMAQDKIQSVLAQASQEIPLAELQSAYLLNDYRSITEYFPEKDRAQVETVLHNALTRMLFYKTELNHLNEVHTELSERKNVEKAISMLHIRRNYKLDKLLGTEPVPAEQLAAVEQDRKMQRAFLLFEYEWGYRCNSRQVDIFRGLLLDDEKDPDKIDAAQARMGFGKTSLLPLVALYKTGDKLVRFIVPKSALETNTADMSVVLQRFGKRAVKDDFTRFKIEKDEESSTVEDSPRLRSLQDAKAELLKKLTFYQRTIKNKEVIVQAPHVRNAIECQAEIFLDLLLKIESNPDEENLLLAAQEKELMECIALINDIRSLTTISVYDELDATQDPLATDVNYTSGEKEPFDDEEIKPLETISLVLRAQKNKTPTELADLLLAEFDITDPGNKLRNFIISQDKPLEVKIAAKHEKTIYLMRGILSDPALRNIFTQKNPSTDFGVWFQTTASGTMSYDYSSLSKDKSVDSKDPLLIAVPYSAANTPKPKGSRFDNPEVTAITTFLYYLAPTTEIKEIPHLEFILNTISKGTTKETPFTDFPKLYEDLKVIASKVDPLLRNEARQNFFKTELKKPEVQSAFRKMLARAIIQEQIEIDSAKANSNRYEQGTVHDSIIGFSGTSGDASSYFKNVRLDPAADGNMTLGIMGRANCQKTHTIDAAGLAQGSEYTKTLIAQLAQQFNENTRTLIDVGGLCKASNREVAKAIAQALQHPDAKNKAIKDNGVIFYDNATNTKKLLTLNMDGTDTVVDLTPDMVKKSDSDGSYFTFYDQAHSRGADIKQKNQAEAILTLSFTVTNNDYKQAIMRMRKIIDKTSGQSFSVAVPQAVREQILKDLELASDAELSGNNIACWLRQKELADNANNVSLMKKELEGVIKNAVLQQQAALTKLMAKEGRDKITPEQIAVFRQCIVDLNKISPLLSMNETGLKAKYGSVFGLVQKQAFIDDLETSFKNKLEEVFDKVDKARETMGLPQTENTADQPYLDMQERIINKRKKGLQEEFYIPSASSALAEVHSEVEAETETETETVTETETETHAFAQVNSEEAIVTPSLQKDPTPLEPLSLDFLDADLDDLSTAHELKSMNRLFTEKDPVRCAPSYDKDPLPPVHYFLARENGEPKIILINQDEADLFKKSGNTNWTLYNLSQEKAGALKPEVGAAIQSLQNPLLKKLLFASFKHKLNTDNLLRIEESLNGLYTRQQLEPTLSINYDTADKHALFSFK